MQFEFVESFGGDELELVLVGAVLLALDEVVGELFEAYFLVAGWGGGYWLMSMRRKISMKVIICCLYFCHWGRLYSTSSMMAVNWVTVTLPL